MSCWPITLETKYCRRRNNLLCSYRYERGEGSLFFPLLEWRLPAGTIPLIQRRHNPRRRSGDCAGRIVPGLLQRWPVAWRQEGPSFYRAQTGDGWGQVVPICYAGDDTNGYCTDDEPHLGTDHRTLYFSSDRSVPTHFPRSREQAQRDFERMESCGYFTDYTNVWSIPLTPWLDGNSNDHGKARSAK